MQSSIDPDEVAKFEAMATQWWDPRGKFRPLHMMNPVRLEFIVREVAAHFRRDRDDARPFGGLRLLDIGCGGGLLSEPMARLGADVVGADAAEGNIPVAAHHAREAGLDIDYRHASAETLEAAGERFDVVLAMEIVEHVTDPKAFLASCRNLLVPGGLLLISTLNRNLKSYAVAIVGAEQVLRWLPRGTHEWGRFITPEELTGMLEEAGMQVIARTGFAFNPLTWRWTLSERDLSVNYALAGTRAQTAP